MNVMKTNFTTEDTIPETETAESQSVGNIEYVTGSSLELNKIFWELEEETMAKGADFTGK